MLTFLQLKLINNMLRFVLQEKEVFQIPSSSLNIQHGYPSPSQGNNRVSCFKDFRKCNFPQLQKLWFRKDEDNLDENFLNEGHSLVWLNLHVLREITIEFMNENDVECEDISWLAKMKIHLLGNL